MSNVLGNLTKAAALLLGVPATALLTYDLMAVRPHLADVEEIVQAAHPQDANPSPLVQRLIDANAVSPAPYATRLVTARIYSGGNQGQWHLRNTLWQVLLPMHLGKEKMYGLYASLAYNGTDYGLNSYAMREFGRPLSQLPPADAARVVAVTHAPSIYLRDPGRLDQRAAMLLERSGHAP
jgi:hypothetical protein